MERPEVSDLNEYSVLVALLINSKDLCGNGCHCGTFYKWIGRSEFQSFLKYLAYAWDRNNVELAIQERVLNRELKSLDERRKGKSVRGVSPEVIGPPPRSVGLPSFNTRALTGDAIKAQFRHHDRPVHRKREMDSRPRIG